MSVSSYCEQAGKNISQALANLLQIPVPENAWVAFACQSSVETADGSVFTDPNNPLNLRPRADVYGPWPGQTGVAQTQSGPFAQFGTLEAGCWACADNYAAGSYDDVLRAFRGGDPVEIAIAIQNSPWDAGHYGGTLANFVKQEVGQVSITKDQYIQEIEPLVKETIKVMISQDGETQQLIAKLTPAGVTADQVVEVLVQRLASKPA